MFPIEPAARLAEQAFGIHGTISLLYSERDQNFRMAGGAQGDFVLKISNAAEDPDLVAAQIAALEFLARTAPDLPLPRVRRTLAGDAQIDLAGEDGARHATFALTYLPGQIASDCPLGPDEFHRIGRMIARVERGLRGFFHRALGDQPCCGTSGNWGNCGRNASTSGQMPPVSAIFWVRSRRPCPAGWTAWPPK
jgi:Ser/Thr protein kinase RdoA (MazF antagonist)